MEIKLNAMNLSNLPTSDETPFESVLAPYQVMNNHIKQMSKQLKEFTSTVDKLQLQLKLNSKTSSKPPSSDRERRASKTRKKSERAKGAQKGHKGSTRVRLEADEIVSCQPIESFLILSLFI